MDLRTIELKIARGENLPVLPQAAHAALKAAEDASASTREIERLIEQDPALTAKVLRVVNSPLYAVSNVTSISRAIAILGLNRTRSVILAVSFQHLTTERYESQGFNMVAYWRHSLAVANAAKIIAAIVAPFHAEEVYCMGMLHDIGLIVMAKFCPGELDALIRAAQTANVPLSVAEPKLVPFTHAQLGGTLAEKWSLGPKIKEAIETHHNTGNIKSDSAAAIIAVADVLAHQGGYTNQVPDVPYELTEEMLAATKLSAEQAEIIKNVMCTEVEKIEKVFDLGPSARRVGFAA